VSASAPSLSPSFADALAQLPADCASPLLADYLTKPQLARELHRTIRTLDRLLLHGDGPPSVRIGKQVLFRREAVLQWLRERETPARPPQGNGRQRRTMTAGAQ
jgi:predicted DNA-binding transcriptional regulator AlpA